MNLLIVGQKWLGAEVLAKLSCSDRVTAATSSENDRVYTRAIELGIPASVHGDALTAAEVPEKTDLIVCAHAHCFITPEAIASARYGAISYHPSLLPLHRGRDAIRWAIHMRDRVTGGTVYWMDEGVDTGPIAAQETCFILPGDTPETLWKRDLGPLGIRLLAQVINDVRNGNIIRLPQQEAAATREPSFNTRSLRLE